MKMRLQLLRKNTIAPDEVETEADTVPHIGEAIVTSQLIRTRFRTLKPHLRVVDVRYEHKDGRLDPIVVCEEHAGSLR
jgi:hypothetical protein